MKIIKPTPSQAAVALKKFFARKNIDIKLSLAQEAIAVSSGYPSWNELAADMPVRAEKSASSMPVVPEQGADLVEAEGMQLWAINCRYIGGDYDDSLYLKWGKGGKEALEAARISLRTDATDGASSDVDPLTDPLAYIVAYEHVGSVVNGKFVLRANLVPTQASATKVTPVAPTVIPAAKETALADLMAQGPTLEKLAGMDAELKNQGMDDEDDRLTAIREVMEDTARNCGLLSDWCYQSGRGEKAMEDAGPFIQVSYDMNHGRRFSTEIVLTLRDAKLEAYVRTWEFKDGRGSQNYAIFDEDSGDFDTDALVPELDQPLAALIQNAIDEADEHVARLRQELNLN